MTIDVTRRLFTVDEYYQMAEAGILAEDDRVELLEGEIVEMSPIPHGHFLTSNYRPTKSWSSGRLVV